VLKNLPDGWEKAHPNQAYLQALRTLPGLTDDYDHYLGPQRIAPGVYLAHTNFSHEIEHLVQEEHPFTERLKVAWNQHSTGLFPYDSYPSDYGVCDDHTQILAKWPELETDPAHFIISLSLITRASQPAQGGWRWHKWGDYIGTKTPRCEYLHDEPEIDAVFCFHIMELKP
jgi:hypothetical protein